MSSDFSVNPSARAGDGFYAAGESKRRAALALKVLGAAKLTRGDVIEMMDAGEICPLYGEHLLGLLRDDEGK